MNILNKLYKLVFPDPVEIEEVYAGVVVDKIREVSRPISYNPALKTIFETNYDQNPDRYDRFFVQLRTKENTLWKFKVPLSIWDKVSTDDDVVISSKRMKTGSGLLSSISDLASETWTLETKNKQGAK